MSDFVSPRQQAMDLIRKIGDDVSQSGQPLTNSRIIDQFSVQLMNELVERGAVKITGELKHHGSVQFFGR